MVKISGVFGLKNRVAIITGGAGLLGEVYCEALAEAGAKLAIVDISAQNCKKLAKRLAKKYGNKIIAIETDISRKSSVDNMVGKVIDKFKRIDILINNAAVDDKVNKESAVKCISFEDYPPELIAKFISVNLEGMIYCCQAVGKIMVKQHRGVIVNIASTYGLVAPDQRVYQDAKGKQQRYKSVAYAVTKAAVIQLTKYLATYWAPYQIRVNTLTPGGVLAGQDREFLKNYNFRTPLGRMAKKDEFIGALLFLVSDASSYMTGCKLDY